MGAGYAAANHTPLAIRADLLDHVQSAFMAGLHAGCFVAASVCALGVLGALALPGSSTANTAAAGATVVR